MTIDIKNINIDVTTSNSFNGVKLYEDDNNYLIVEYEDALEIAAKLIEIGSEILLQLKGRIIL